MSQLDDVLRELADIKRELAEIKKGTVVVPAPYPVAVPQPYPVPAPYPVFPYPPHPGWRLAPHWPHPTPYWQAPIYTLGGGAGEPTLTWSNSLAASTDTVQS